jgi:hypothetical protein
LASKAFDDIGTEACGEHEDVLAAAIIERVIAPGAVEGIVATPSAQAIVAPIAHEHVGKRVAGTADGTALGQVLDVGT